MVLIYKGKLKTLNDCFSLKGLKYILLILLLSKTSRLFNLVWWSSECNPAVAFENRTTLQRAKNTIRAFHTHISIFCPRVCAQTTLGHKTTNALLRRLLIARCVCVFYVSRKAQTKAAIRKGICAVGDTHTPPTIAIYFAAQPHSVLCVDFIVYMCTWNKVRESVWFKRNICNHKFVVGFSQTNTTLLHGPCIIES